MRKLARSWIVDLKGRNVRVNVISAGVVPTPGYDGKSLSKEQIQGFVDAQVSTIPVGRVGTTSKSPRPFRSWLRMTAASSTAWNSSSTAE